MSMRETENEINLLRARGPADARFNEPPWDFGAALAATTPPAGEADDEPDGDELGDSTLTGRATR